MTVVDADWLSTSYEDVDWLSPETFNTIPPESDSVLNVVREVLVKDGKHEEFLFLVDDTKPNYHGFAWLHVMTIAKLLKILQWTHTICGSSYTQ